MRTLSRLKFVLLAGALVGLAAQVRAAEVDKYLPNDAEVAVVVNVKQLAEAPLVKKHVLTQLKALMQGNADLSKILEAVGFDPLRDLSSITLAGNGFSGNAKGLVIAHGQFDTAKIEAKAEEVAKEKADHLKILKEGNHKLYEVTAPNNEKPLIVALVDRTTIVASNEKDMVVDALAKAAGSKKSEIKSALRALIEKQDAGQTVWAVIPGEVLSKSDFAAADERTKKISEKVENITFSLTVGKDIKLALIVAAKSADNAKELAEEFKQGLDQAKGMVAILGGQDKKFAPAIEMVNSIKVATEGSNLTVKGELSEELIEKSVKDKE